MPPILIYDGNCGFCTTWIRRMRRITGESVHYASSQEVGERYPQITREQLQRSVWLVEPNGEISAAAEAVFRALSFARGWRWPLFLYRFLPGFARITEFAYRTVAAKRHTCRISL
ncbi:MAG TPA: DCC1-like thiol-disulfide oxidoreductase family protein [Candidatus Peribacterales bacterium]|nr:DCC1-like thiol-disulfide oxidoreductase family protein [Candidatus Peribacterales bacterium]